MKALGRLFDIGSAFVPTDVVAGAVTGARVSMKNCSGITFVLITNGASTDIIDIDVQQATAASGGTSGDLDVVTEWYKKSETTLDNDEVWTRVTQAAASEVTDMGAASEQLLAVVEIEANQLSDGYSYISVNVPDAGSNATLFAAGIYIMHGLRFHRLPTRLPAPLS